MIKHAKGWKTDADMARSLGLTRAYVSMLHHARVSVSSTVITRLAASLGNVEGNWWIYFEIVPRGEADRRHPYLNMEKHNGQIPYNQYSSSGELRKQDYMVEFVKDSKHS